MQRRRITYRPNQVQGKSWISVIWGIMFLLVGVGVISPLSRVLGIAWSVFSICFIAKSVYQAISPKNASKLDDDLEEVVSRIRNRVPEKKTVRSKQETHDHIPSTALNVEARLEQLRSLKEAGLLDNAEYEQRKQKLFKGQ